MTDEKGSEKDAIKYGLAVLKCDDSGDSDFAKGLRLLKSKMEEGRVKK